jgi:hypothetical protein
VAPAPASASAPVPASTRDPARASSLRRIALCLQYDGAVYCGWQRQPRDPSVQETLEAALAQLDPHRPAAVVAAGRTDSGVHAAGQVVHFDAAGPIPAQRWADALNGRLPASIPGCRRPCWRSAWGLRSWRYRTRPPWASTMARSWKSSAADGAHRPVRLDEAGLADVMLELLAPDGRADQLLQVVIAGS